MKRLPWLRASRGPSWWAPDVLAALRGREQFRVVESQSQVASSLWDFGEDDLADRARVMSLADLAAILRISAVYEDPDYPLPVQGVRISHGHVSALAAIAYFEGSLRPLSRRRRRPRSQVPPRFEPRPLDFATSDGLVFFDPENREVSRDGPPPRPAR